MLPVRLMAQGLTNAPACAERELVLLKIRAPPGPTRTEVMQLIDIFRARVVDVSDRSLTIAVTGDAGKVKPIYNPFYHPHTLDKALSPAR